MPDPDIDRAAVEAAALYEPAPVSGLARLRQVDPDLAARLDDLAQRILTEVTGPQVPAESGMEWRPIRPAIHNSIALRMFAEE
jgi:hypothetical protein